MNLRPERFLRHVGIVSLTAIFVIFIFSWSVGVLILLACQWLFVGRGKYSWSYYQNKLDPLFDDDPLFYDVNRCD